MVNGIHAFDWSQTCASLDDVVVVQVAMRCSGVERAVSILSGSELVLFVRLNPATATVLSQSQSEPMTCTDQLSAAGDVSDGRLMDKQLMTCTDQRRDNAASPAAADNNDNMTDVVSGVSHGRLTDKQLMTAQQAACGEEIKTFLRQWLPLHCQPDHVEVVVKMPSTNHGQLS